MAAAREHWGSRFGFIMAAAGSAVGLGNIWKFPYETGANGGGAFLLLYLLFIVVFGASLILAEMVLGRASGQNPVGAFRSLGGGRWPLVGYLGVFTGFVILSFYIVIAGWTIAYMGFMLDGSLISGDAESIGAKFSAFISGGATPVLLAGLFMVATVIVVLGGIGKGIERASKLLMPVLFVLLLVLIARSVSLPGAGEGLRFFLVPDWSKVDGGTFTSAIGQAFFSLSLGMGALITYGSYLPKTTPMPGSAAIIVGLDTLVALLAGFMILPAVFAYGLDPAAGPGLTFVTLPVVFSQMPAGAIFGFVFFALLFVAALTSAVSLLEVVVTYLVDETRLTRRPAALIAGCICFGLGVPSSLSQGAVDIQIFGMDFLTAAASLTDLLLPIGGLCTALFVGWKLGPKSVALVTNNGTQRFALATVWLFILRFVAPIGIAYVLISGML
ncbi:MAG: sodium-dependent transporter [Abyssibacter sp.]|nr:sodium-dependent transporter [Abyssibacter sp.]